MHSGGVFPQTEIGADPAVSKDDAQTDEEVVKPGLELRTLAGARSWVAARRQPRTPRTRNAAYNR